MRIMPKPWLYVLTLGVVAMFGSVVPAAVAGDDSDAHQHHHHMTQKTTLMTADYTLPTVEMVRDDGKTILLPLELNDGRPVIMNFIYTSCTSICPVTSQTFSQLQGKLGSDREKVHMVSISIDPEQDTPARLAAYARKFSAGPQWRYYTGTTEASLAVQRAFNVYRGDKMSHTPVTLIRAAPGKSWARIDGFATADDLLREYHDQVAIR